MSTRSQNAAIWWMIGIIAAIDIVWMTVSGFRLSLGGAIRPLLVLLVIAVTLGFYSKVRRDERIEATLTGVLQLLAYGVVAAPFSYLMASLNLPLWDGTLYAWDRAMGLDWRGYLDWVNARPAIGTVLKIAYDSLMVQLILACALLGLTGRATALRQLLLAICVTGILCDVLSGLMPAMAMYVHLGLTPADYPGINPSAAFIHVADLEALRNGSMRVLNLAGMQGIVTFPSFHTTLAVLLTVAFWSVPYLRWASLALNGLMIAGTPIHGAHYFVDLGGGFALAIVGYTAARSLSRERVVRRTEPQPVPVPG